MRPCGSLFHHGSCVQRPPYPRESRSHFTTTLSYSLLPDTIYKTRDIFRITKRRKDYIPSWGFRFLLSPSRHRRVRAPCPGTALIRQRREGGSHSVASRCMLLSLAYEQQHKVKAFWQHLMFTVEIANPRICRGFKAAHLPELWHAFCSLQRPDIRRESARLPGG